MATPREQLEALRRLGENWDGYGAAPPQASVIDLAQEFTSFLEAMLAKSATAPIKLQVSPTRVEGILIEWEDPLMQHELELNPDDSIGFLHLTKASGRFVLMKRPGNHFPSEGRGHTDPNDPLEQEYVKELARLRREDLEQTLREYDQECSNSPSTPTS